MICSYRFCDRKSHAAGFCNKHYMIHIRTTDPIKRKKEVEYTKQWKLKNKEAHAKQLSKYREKNKLRLSQYYIEWRTKNKTAYNAYQASRKKRVKLVTPQWANLEQIKDFYMKCPNGYHVDHIIPINGEKVSGLHVMDNLQYLPAIENLSKGNKYIP